MNSVAENVASYLSKLPRHVQLVAVSKTKSAGVVGEAYSAGQRHFGENYVQEICEKAPQLPSDILWHFIGHLQTNKVKQLIKAVRNLSMIETVDSVKLADAIQTACLKVERDKIKVLVEVCTSNEGTKSGVDLKDVDSLVDHIRQRCDRLDFCGFMTVADPATPITSFQTLADLRDATCKRLGLTEMILSMGMSGDWEEATRLGATEIRIGSAIFGSRS